MTAGNGLYRIGEVTASQRTNVAGHGRGPRTTREASFTLALPGPNERDCLEYNKRLMQLCQL
eukprot:5298001-Lingulodinium_polyedra.AAC.1